MYKIEEISLADTHRLYQYKLKDVFGADFSLKGFEYPWIISSHQWKKDERVLDVGSAYSRLPIHIQKTYGCETWAVDDFGLHSNEPFWARHKSPYEYVAEHPEVKFVLERLGVPDKTSLPKGYFDIIYSASTLEHVPDRLMPKVWEHMHILLKPGGEMIHAIDLAFPSNGGIKAFIKSLGIDIFYELISKSRKLQYCRSTPKTYAKLVFETLGNQYRIGVTGLSVIDMVLDPETLTENYSIGFNRIIKDNRMNYRYYRAGALLVRMKKLDSGKEE